MSEQIPCPYVYAKGKKCTGHVVRVAAFGADIEWRLGDDGGWRFSVGRPRSHYHVYCSEKGNHAGAVGDDALKFYPQNLPGKLAEIISAKA
jgi:hypothetical protein